MHGCAGAHELAIANEVRVEYLCYSGICESFGAFDGELRDAFYRFQDSGYHENDRVFVPTQVLVHAFDIASTAKDDLLARETANGFSLYTEKVVIFLHNSMLVSSVIDAEQELDVSHGFAAEHLELVLEL